MMHGENPGMAFHFGNVHKTVSLTYTVHISVDYADEWLAAHNLLLCQGKHVTTSVYNIVALK